MKDRKVAGLIMSMRKPDQKPDDQSDDHVSEAAQACAQDVYDAISSNDIKKLASALYAAFQIFDSEPHVEGPHTEDSEE